MGIFPKSSPMHRDIDRNTLQDYLDVVIYRDIIERHKHQALWFDQKYDFIDGS